MRGESGRPVDAVEAGLAPDEPSAHQMPAYAEKYQERITQALRMTPEAFAAQYSPALRVQPLKVRGF